jgi:hypothetical protein
MTTTWILIAFIVKHFIADFPLQPPYQWMNKGKYGHPGGLLHAGIHATFTLAILWWFDMQLWLAAVDGVVHYQVDWLKTQLPWKPDNKYFWWALGVDQMLHYLTYTAIIAWSFQ